MWKGDLIKKQLIMRRNNAVQLYDGKGARW